MRIRSKLLLAMLVPLGLLVAQILAMNAFIHELQLAATFISSAHTVIEADFEAVELVSVMRQEVKRLPAARYVTHPDGYCLSHARSHYLDRVRLVHELDE